MNTRDLSKFGIVELKEAADLLTAYKTDNDKTEFFYGEEGVAVEFNPNNGDVFLVDNDFNVAMMADNNLEDWFVLSYAGHEGFLDNLIQMYRDGEIVDKEDIEQLTYFAEIYRRSLN